MDEPRRSDVSLRQLIVAASLIALLIFLGPVALRIPLTDPDEGFHASIAQEMVERGDWVTPRFQGEAFFDKPILFTWAQALSLKLLGMNEDAVRLPGLLFGLAAMLATGVVGWRSSGPERAYWPRCSMRRWSCQPSWAQLAVHDVALVPFAALATLLFWEADRASGFRTKAGLAVTIGVLLGLSCLTKGFVGVGLVGVSYGSYLLVTRRLSLEACVRGAAALAIAGLIALPWYLAMEARNPGYLHYYFVERHLLGFATESQRHGGEPWWYYLPIILSGGLPWILYLPVAVRDWWERRKGESRRPGESRFPGDGGTTLLWCWFLACTVLLSAAGSKLVTYIWPVFPPVAVLAAAVWARLLDGELSQPAFEWFGRCFAPIGWIGLLLLPLSLPVLNRVLGLPVPWYAVVLAVLVGLSAWIPARLWSRAWPKPCRPACSSPPHMLFVLAFVLPHLATQHNAKDLAEYFNRRGRLPGRSCSQQRVGSVVFYLKPELRRRLTIDQFRGQRRRVRPRPGNPTRCMSSRRSTSARSPSGSISAPAGGGWGGIAFTSRIGQSSGPRGLWPNPARHGRGSSPQCRPGKLENPGLFFDPTQVLLRKVEKAPPLLRKGNAADRPACTFRNRETNPSARQADPASPDDRRGSFSIKPRTFRILRNL